MSEVSPRGEGPLPLSLGLRIEPACNRFELAWQAGERPRLEDHLGGVPEAERPGVLCELIALDIDYRRRAGEQPRAAESRVSQMTLSFRHGVCAFSRNTQRFRRLPAETTEEPNG